MNTEKTLKVLLILSVLPLLFALFLALYFGFNLADLNTITYKFSRLNSYIYAHSYGAILLTMFCGISLGQLVNKQDAGWAGLLYFILMLTVWMSFKSFADWQGMTYLIFCWLFYVAFFIKNRKLLDLPDWFYYSGLKILIVIIFILGSITLINQ